MDRICVVLIFLTVTVTAFNGPPHQNIPGSDFCTNTFGNPVDLSIVVDRSSSWIVKNLRRIADFIDLLENSNPGSRFGVTSFSDWQELRGSDNPIVPTPPKPPPPKPHRRPPRIRACIRQTCSQASCSLCPKGSSTVIGATGNGCRIQNNRCTPATGYVCVVCPYTLALSARNELTEMADCYAFHLKLTSNLGEVKNSLGSIQHQPHGGREASVSALLFTAAEKKMGWDSEPQYPDLNTAKIIVILTDSGYHNPPNNVIPDPDKKRRNATGDGSDTCDTIQPPTHADVGKVLRMHNISVFSMLVSVHNDSTPLNVTEEWKDYGNKMDVKYDQFELKDNFTATSLLQPLKEFINRVSPMEEFISCEDPPAYNTLGL